MRCRGLVPRPADCDRRHERSESLHRVVDAIRRAAAILAGEIRDVAAFCAVGECSVQSVRCKERPHPRERVGDGECGEHKRLRHQAPRDHAPASESIRQRAHPRRESGTHDMQQGPEQRQLRGARAEFARAREQEQVDACAERSERDDDEEWQQSSRVAAVAVARGTRVARRLLHEQGDRDDAEQAGRERPREHFALGESEREERERGERPGERTSVVERSHEAECPSSCVRSHGIREQCVARRLPQALADAIRGSHSDCRPRRSDHRVERAQHCGQRVTEQDPRAPPRLPVREPAAREFEPSDDEVAEPLEHSERQMRPAERCEKGRQQRHDHLACDIGAERHGAEREHDGRQRVARGAVVPFARWQ